VAKGSKYLAQRDSAIQVRMCKTRWFRS